MRLKKYYSSREVTALTGLTADQLRWWERQKLISELRAGQRIMFGGGLIGTVAEVKEHTFMVEVSPKVTIEIARGAVARVLNSDEKPVLEDQR